MIVIVIFAALAGLCVWWLWPQTGEQQRQSTPIIHGSSPAWVNELIIYQLRLETFTPEGTLEAARRKLPYLQELGVTALWLSPIFQGTTDPQQMRLAIYNNFEVKEPDRLNAAYGTMEDWDRFVEDAHAIGMKVFLDIVPHGVTFDSTLVTNHPDWFKQDANGVIVPDQWAMAPFDWSNERLRDWWVNMAKDWALKHHVDGFRTDLEPDVSGYDLWRRVRNEINDAGKEIVIYSELPNTRQGAYDFEQVGVGIKEASHIVNGSGDYLREHPVADVVKKGLDLTSGGTSRYYTEALSVHDTNGYNGEGSRFKFGYELLFSPFIPVFFAGEEFQADDYGQMLFFVPLDWNKLEENRAFWADVKKMIAIRKEYADIFTDFPENHREANIVTVNSTNHDLSAYARFNGRGTAIVIIGNPHDEEKTSSVQMPLKEMKLDGFSTYRVTNLMDGTTSQVDQTEIQRYAVSVGSDNVKVLKFEGE
jgi:1,4-alpha-glucan branching enzyme